VSGTYQDSQGVDRLYFPAFDTPATNGGIAEGLDGERLKQSYVQIQRNGLTFTGAYGWRQRDVPTASFGTLFNEQHSREQTTDRHTLADLEYVRPFFGNGRVTTRAAYDRFTYDGTYPFEGADADAPAIVGHNGVVGSRFTVGARVTHALIGRQVVTVGTEFIDNTGQNQRSYYVNPDVSLFDIRRSSKQRAVYADDELKLTPWLILNGGLRYDGYEKFTRVTPRSGVIVTPSSIQSFKYLYGTAFRAPNEWELNSFYFGESVAALRPETIATHELVWERYTNDWLRTSVSTYRYRAEQLITLVPEETAFLGTTFVNSGRVVARGLELEAQMRLPRGVQGMASYALQQVEDVDTGVTLANSPRHMAKVRASGLTGLHGSTLSVELLGIGSRRTIGGQMVGRAATADVTTIVPLTRSLALTASVHNLFDVRYFDPASDAHRQDVVPQNGRTLRVSARLKLWNPKP
jgi:iron complex outermembrane receptor protein